MIDKEAQLAALDTHPLYGCSDDYEIGYRSGHKEGFEDGVRWIREQAEAQRAELRRNEYVCVFCERTGQGTEQHPPSGWRWIRTSKTMPSIRELACTTCVARAKPWQLK